MNTKDYFQGEAKRIRDDRVALAKREIIAYGVIDPENWEIEASQYDVRASYRFSLEGVSDFQVKYLGEGRFRLLQYAKTGTAVLQDWTGNWDRIVLVIDEFLHE